MNTPKILLIDNFDSFTYNVVELLRKIGHSCDVAGYDKFDIESAESYSHIIISPGPGHPDEYTKHYALLNRFKHSKKILGICLGHQIIARYYGGELLNLPQVRHGIGSEIQINDYNELLFCDCCCSG
jgi:para-aminobenzoate synthetase component 2